MNENDQEQEKRKKGAIDYGNEAINKGQSIYNNARRIQSGIKAIRGGAAAAQGGEAVVATVGSEIWIPFLIFFFFLAVIVIPLLVIFGGGSQAAKPTCDTITASDDTANPTKPITITLDNCTSGAIFSWSTDGGGTFNPPDGQITTFTPAAVTTSTSVTITASVCSAKNTANCTQYTVSVTVFPSDCAAQGGNCVASNICNSGNDLKPIPGSCTTTGTVCCSGVAAPTCANVDQRLLSDFGVRTKPVTEAVSCLVKKKIYQIYSIPFQSPTYVKNLRPATPFTLEFYKGTYGRAKGYTPSGYTIELTGFASFISNSSWFNLGSFLLQHETGHLIKHRNYTKFYTNFPYSRLLSNDASCFNSCRVIKTYSLCPGPLYNRSSETMAEITALYVYNSKTGNFGTISNFRTQCNDSYAYIRGALYGGTAISP